MTANEKAIREAAYTACADLLLAEVDALSVKCMMAPHSIKPCLREALKALETVRLSVLRLGGIDDVTAPDGAMFIEEESPL